MLHRFHRVVWEDVRAGHREFHFAHVATILGVPGHVVVLWATLVKAFGRTFADSG